jgi:hypothetical protein
VTRRYRLARTIVVAVLVTVFVVWVAHTGMYDPAGPRP